MSTLNSAIQIEDSQREVMHFSPESKKLLISKSHAGTAFVRGYIAKLNRLGVAHTIEYADPSDVADAYRLHTAPVSKDTLSEKQEAAKAMFSKAVLLHASDIHIRVGLQTEILARVHGDIELIDKQTREYGEQLCMAIYHAMSDISDTTFDVMSRQDARISDRDKMPESLDGIRIATSPQVGGFIMVLRLLYRDTLGSDLSSLGFLPVQVNQIEIIKRRPYGINIIAGPTGSGKSTTLQYILRMLVEECKGQKHVITVEDPPEYSIPGVVQTPVTNVETEEDRSRAFQGAIKSAMRLDPDVIMIGEIRDSASARLAVQAAMTGHQVWSTLHANTAFSSTDRMIDLGVPADLVFDAGIITGLSCQRLIKVLCPQCKLPLSTTLEKMDDVTQARIPRYVQVGQAFSRNRGHACQKCGGKGVVGRSVLDEHVVTDDRLMALLKDKKKADAIQYWRDEKNGLTMIDHAIIKVNEGMIDPLDAEDVVGIFVS